MSWFQLAFSVGTLSIPTLIEINGYSYNWRIMRKSCEIMRNHAKSCEIMRNHDEP